MTCSYCGTRNADDEHRCRRCGRRPGDVLTAGALAAKPQPAVNPGIEAVPRPSVAAPTPRAVPNYSRAVQGTLFPGSTNVVPIRPPAPPARAPRPRAAGTNPPVRRPPRVSEAQGSLEFLPAMQPKPRTLGTTVEAVIFCESPVATPLHRAVAGALDWAMVLIGYGIFLLAYRISGGGFVLNKLGLMVFGGALAGIVAAYGLLWAIAGCETAGMHWTHLRLTTFEGSRPERRQRLVRFASTCLSLMTVAGVLWALSDEESLAWQDHMSGTFPTPRESELQVFQRR